MRPLAGILPSLGRFLVCGGYGILTDSLSPRDFHSELKVLQGLSVAHKPDIYSGCRFLRLFLGDCCWLQSCWWPLDVAKQNHQLDSQQNSLEWLPDPAFNLAGNTLFAECKYFYFFLDCPFCGLGGIYFATESPIYWTVFFTQSDFCSSCYFAACIFFAALRY